MYNPINGDVGALFPPRRGGGPVAPMRNNRAGMIGNPLQDRAMAGPQPPTPLGAGVTPPDTGGFGGGPEPQPNQGLLNNRDALLQALSDRVRRMGGGGVV